MQDLASKISAEINKSNESKEKCPAMDETRSELLKQQKELLEKLNTQLLYIRKMEDSQGKILDLVGYEETINNLSSELATVKERQREQELSKLIEGSDGKESLKSREQSKKLKRKLPDRRQDLKKPKGEIEEKNLSSEEEDDEDGDPMLTPIKPLKRISLKREKNVVEEEYKKEIQNLKKKIKSQKLSIKLSKEQKERDQSDLLKELSKEYSTMKKLFKENGFQDSITKLSQICKEIPKEVREKPSNGLGVKVQQSVRPETPVDHQSSSADRQKCAELQKQLEFMAGKQGKLESELLAAREREKEVLEVKEAEIRKLKEEHAEKDRRIKSHLSEDREKVLFVIKEKEESSQKIRRLQRLLAEKDVEVKQLESSNSESKTKISILEESNATLNSDKNQIKDKSEKTLAEFNSLKQSHQQIEKQLENCKSEANKPEDLPISDKDRESSEKHTEGMKKEVNNLKIEIRRLKEEIIEKDKLITDVKKRSFQTHAEVESLKKTLEEKYSENAKLNDSLVPAETPAENQDKSAAETQTESENDNEKFKARIRSFEENLKVQKTNNRNLNKKVEKQSRMLKNIAKKYVKLQKEEKFNAHSIQISANIIEKLENELSERNKSIENFQL